MGVYGCVSSHEYPLLLWFVKGQAARKRTHAALVLSAVPRALVLARARPGAGKMRRRNRRRLMLTCFRPNSIAFNSSLSAFCFWSACSLDTLLLPNISPSAQALLCASIPQPDMESKRQAGQRSPSCRVDSALQIYHHSLYFHVQLKPTSRPYDLPPNPGPPLINKASKLLTHVYQRACVRKTAGRGERERGEKKKKKGGVK
ncbi:hypothetical protein IWZ03DRAFT_236633 [Phyllosticta citriasiana]|uniref:Uncharacterized protein n=1 Tax=Phyllosticta citriasiana TaxID=595635 RepID=A0ABR1KJX5_9PEZI